MAGKAVAGQPAVCVSVGVGVGGGEGPSTQPPPPPSATPSSSPDLTNQGPPPTSTPHSWPSQLRSGLCPPSPPGFLLGPKDRHGHLPAPACHWPAVQPLSPSPSQPVQASRHQGSLRVAARKDGGAFPEHHCRPPRPPPQVHPGPFPTQPCPSAGVQRPLPVKPCGVHNPRVPAAPGMDHWPCAHGSPRLCCSALRNGGPELRKALCHGLGSVLVPDSGRQPSRELPTSGAGAWLCSPACSARRISVTAPDAVDVASPASPAPTWLCHRAGFSGRSQTRVASPRREAVGGLLGRSGLPMGSRVSCLHRGLCAARRPRLWFGE